MKKVFLSFAFVLLSIVALAQGTWEADTMHSSINFNIKHMGISFVQGRFDKFDGRVVNSGANLDNADVSFAVSVRSINTGLDMRDRHLVSEEFFDAAKFPAIEFKSSSITKDKNNNYILKGKLTMRGVEKEISVPVTFGGITKNKDGKEIMGIQTKFTVNRLDYGIKYDPSGAGIAKDVELTAYFELVKQ
ncbi:YceI family protein [Chryseobacterium viscerum]|uniref:YceI family protein n=1 Tax=Chryseobacterium viscerum TaxID=1037377 RepID=A0A5N4BP68_9FLAO|nr:YceI family protein [Chryseobacterium viscerum]KAB1230217.1 YceI family protein [Chryseobacterium viscerum]